MLKCCICDDDAKDLAAIRALAEDFAKAHPEFPLAVEPLSSSRGLLERLEANGGFDLYLLDILMPQLSGTQLAEHIRARQESAEIIFLTVSREYAVDAFDVAACDYLVKPVDRERFEQAMLRAIKRLAPPEEPALPLKTKEGLRRLLFRELVMVESFNHDQVCTLADGTQCVTSDTLTALMERLGGDARFFSPHRSYIINLEHITALHTDHVLLAGDLRVPVVQAALPTLKRAYVAYLSQMGR